MQDPTRSRDLGAWALFEQVTPRRGSLLAAAVLLWHQLRDSRPALSRCWRRTFLGCVAWLGCVAGWGRAVPWYGAMARATTAPVATGKDEAPSLAGSTS